MPLTLGSAELTQQTNRVFVPGGLIMRLFFAGRKYTPEKYVKVVTTKGGRRLAPYVSPKIGGKVMTKEGKTVDVYEPPMLKPKYITEADSILEDQSIFYGDGMTAQDRAEERLIEDEKQLKTDVYRRMEHQAVSVATTGKFTANGEGVEEEFDYGMDADNIEVLTGTNLWSDGGSNPLGDIDRWCDEVFVATGKAPTAIVMGTSAYASFKVNAKVVAAFDKRNIFVGQIKPSQMLDENGTPIQGVTHIGRYEDKNLEMYVYKDVYVDEAGVTQEMFPVDRVILGDSYGTGHFAFAGITDKKELGNQVFVGEVFVKSWTQDDPDDEYLLGKSKPMPVPSDIDSFKSVKVV